MIHTNETPPLGLAGLEENAFLGGNCSSEITPKAHVAQAKANLLRDDLTANISQMSLHLDVALATLAAADDCGLIYSLRRCAAYWKAISGSARDFVALRSEGQP